MHFRLVPQGVAQPLTHFALQVPQHAANLLEGESLAAQLGDHRHFNYLVGEVYALVPVMAGRDDVLFVPPLQLAQAHAGNASNVAAGVDSVRWSRSHGSRFSCFEHFTPLSFFRIASMDCTRLDGTVKSYFNSTRRRRTERSQAWRPAQARWSPIRSASRCARSFRRPPATAPAPD